MAPCAARAGGGAAVAAAAGAGRAAGRAGAARQPGGAAAVARLGAPLPRRLQGGRLQARPWEAHDAL